jgi:uncharacterized protein YkwD
MRRLALSLLLLVPSACGEDKDPLTGVTNPGTDPGSTGGDEPTTEATTGPVSDSNVTTQPSTSAPTSTPSTSETTVSSVSATDVTEGPTSDPSTSLPTSESDTETVTSANPTTQSTTENPTGDPDEGATQLCVDEINMYRATLGLPALARWTDAEACSDSEAQQDGQSGTPHGAFGQCGESAQNECPGWPGPPEAMIADCLALMWAEGPGEDFNMHGHYINMSNPAYTKVACGFAEVNGEIWAVQNFQ